MTMQTALLVAIIAATVTAIGWYTSYRSTQALAFCKDRLEFANKQLSELYGPLHISCESGRAAYKTLLKKLGRNTGILMTVLHRQIRKLRSGFIG
jgi:hypothetical protein